MEEEILNPGHASKRSVLRILGPIVLLTGIVLMAVGFINFMMSMGTGSGPPRLFWCFMLGMPVLFVGIVMTKIGFLGAVARYMAAESAPVAKDTFNYMADGTKDGVRDITTAIREGITGEHGSVHCNDCGHENDSEAQFCDQCGETVGGVKACFNCKTSNAHDAKFCDSCGTSFGK